jgi:polyhydroxyalkanoate synthesis regulator phasin
MKFLNVQLSKLQSNISFEKYKAGIATIAEARQQIVNTIDVLRATGGSNADIEKQIQLYQKLSDAQIKQTKTLQSGLSRQQFIDSVQESIVALNKNVIDLGVGTKKTVHVEQALIGIRNQVLKGTLSQEEAQKQINLVLAETTMSFDKLRERNKRHIHDPA